MNCMFLLPQQPALLSSATLRESQNSDSCQRRSQTARFKKSKKRMTQPRLELGTFCVLDRCDNQLRHRALFCDSFFDGCDLYVLH